MSASTTLPPSSAARPRAAAHGARRRRRARRGAVALLVLAGILGAIAALSYDGQLERGRARPLPPAVAARRAVSAFLGRYVRPDGRVVRADQGGDTVSEGQAYGLLLSLVVGRRQSFARIWRWEHVHLQEPDGLFAWRWAGGHVVGRSPASDADLLTAFALVRAARSFEDPAYLVAGRRVAEAVLAHETVRAGRHLLLAAGPWATGRPALVNPSYLVPEAFAALYGATRRPAFRQLAASGTAVLLALERASRAGLPPDWAEVEPSGALRATGTPSSPRPPRYALDAERVAVWFAASCQPAARAVAAEEWAGLRASADHGGAIAYSLAGRRLTRLVAPLGYVAAAAAASAAGRRSALGRLLAAATRQQRLHPTYYGGAWLALGRVLLQTDWLGHCGR